MAVFIPRFDFQGIRNGIGYNISVKDKETETIHVLKVKNSEEAAHAILSEHCKDTMDSISTPKHFYFQLSQSVILHRDFAKSGLTGNELQRWIENQLDDPRPEGGFDRE